MNQGTTQSNVESLADFIKRSIDETLAEKNELLTRHLPFRHDGLGLADIGAKVAKLEGKLEALRDFNIRQGDWN